MSRLPPIMIEGRPCALPLSEPTASALLCALLCCDDTQGGEAQKSVGDLQSKSATQASLTEALSLDPALALWTAFHRSRALGSSDSEPASIVALATFLASRLGDILHDELAHTEASSDEETTQNTRGFAKLAAAAVLRAQQASSGSDAGAGPRYLAELLADADEWLPPSGTDQSFFKALPHDLGRSSLAATSPSAIRKTSKKSGAKPTVGSPASSEDTPQQDRARAAGDRWLVPAGLASRQFTATAARLIRLKDLEANFAERLLEEKLHALGEFAAGAGHEINNPLAVISGRAQLFLRHETDPDRRRELAVINTQARRVHEMIADLMLFARPPQPRPAPCDAPSLVNAVIAELAQRATERNVALRSTISADPLPPISADATQIQVALRAVIENALDAAPDGGAVVVAVDLHESQPRADKAGMAEGAGVSVGRVTTSQLLAITVRDNGPGIDTAGRRNLFDPFYAGRAAGRGVGMGLSKCWRIVTGHGGRVEVENQASGGACVTILLPLAPG